MIDRPVTSGVIEEKIAEVRTEETKHDRADETL